MENMNIEAMLESIDFSQVEKKIVKLNMANRLPIVILVDISDSMSNYEKLLKYLIEGLYDEILKDRAASNATELAVLSFNNDVEILEKLCEIKTQENRGKNLNFHCMGDTLIGLALKSAIMQIEARKKVYIENSPKIRYYSPIIFLVSDGKPYCSNAMVRAQEDEAMKFSKDYICKEVAANRLIVISVEIGDKCDNDFMRELTSIETDKYITKVNNATELVDFFKFFRMILSLGLRRL